MENESEAVALEKLQRADGGQPGQQNNENHEITATTSSSELHTQIKPRPSTNLEKLCGDLKASLRQSIGVITSVTPERENAAPLTLSELDESLERVDNEFDAESFSLRRKEMVKLRKGSGVSPHVGGIFTHALVRAMESDERRENEDQVEFRDGKIKSSPEKRGKLVGIVGPAGAGKTTMMHQWLKQVNEAELFNPTSFVFLVTIKLLKLTEKMTLLQFLTSHLLPEWTCSPEEEKQLIEFLLKDKDVLIVFDGIDDASFRSFSNTPSPLPAFETAKPKVFIENLLSGKLLPLSRKIVTSGPGLLHKLPASLCPPRVLQIQGLSKNSQENLGRNLYKKRYDKYKETLEQNPNLLSHCHVPYNFKLVLNYLMFPQTEEVPANITMTQILASTLLHRLDAANYATQKDFKLSNLLQLAWSSLHKRKSFIKTKKFRKMKLDLSTIQKFLNLNSDNILSVGEKSCHFSSIIWHHFFVAIYLMTILSVRDFKSQLNLMANETFSGVTCFLFGLCDETIMGKLQTVLPKGSTKHHTTKMKLLEGLALSVLKEGSHLSLIRVCSWVHESNKTSLRLSVRNSMPSKINLARISLLRWELYNLVHLLQTATTQQLQVLDLSGNDIGDKGSTLLSHCITCIQELKLDRCGIGRNGVRDISGGISARRSPMKKLSISGNRIGDVGTSFISECLHCIEDLELVDCGVEINGVQELTGKILELPAPMKRLDLSWNHLTDTGAAVLASCVHKLRKLEVVSCGFTSAGRRAIKRRLRSLNLQIFRVVFEKGAIEFPPSEVGDSEI